jgi:hypothetical protein
MEAETCVLISEGIQSEGSISAPAKSSHSHVAVACLLSSLATKVESWKLLGNLLSPLKSDKHNKEPHPIPVTP